MGINKKGFANILLVVLLVLIVGAVGYFVLIQKPTTPRGIRAGLDFRVEVTDHGVKKIATCDICTYSDFSDSDTYFQTHEVHAKEGYVEMLFLKKSDYNPTYNGPEINYQDVFVTDEQQFNIGYHRVFRIRIGQTVLLQGADIAIRLLDVTGLGCSPGAKC